jgi:two-component system, cell cycle response regulator
MIVPSTFALLALGILVSGAAIGDVGPARDRSGDGVAAGGHHPACDDIPRERANAPRQPAGGAHRRAHPPAQPPTAQPGLEQALESAAEEPGILVLFDLNGFKSYNDTFGHPAGDALLAGLGRQLDAVAARTGRAYRMGGDEFCVLAKLGAEYPRGDDRGVGARTERPRGRVLDTCSHSWCCFPEDGLDSTTVLSLADQAMYRNKQRSPSSPARQSMDVLVAALQQRDGSLGSHGSCVAHLAERVAAQLGLPGEEIELIRKGAKLHDIGKVAIPDAILNKPGPLDSDEWAFIRRHTLIGESIIAAAPSLVPVAELVRSSHERIDGSGYPDALNGPDIPIGSRIIAVCDAFDAMTSDRSYSQHMTVGVALAELERCAGTQCDPDVLAAFMSLVEIVPAPDGRRQSSHTVPPAASRMRTLAPADGDIPSSPRADQLLV